MIGQHDGVGSDESGRRQRGIVPRIGTSRNRCFRIGLLVPRLEQGERRGFRCDEFETHIDDDVAIGLAGANDVAVGSLAAIQPVGAFAPHQPVGARPAEEFVIPLTADQRVVVPAAFELVIAALTIGEYAGTELVEAREVEDGRRLAHLVVAAARQDQRAPAEPDLLGGVASRYLRDGRRCADVVADLRDAVHLPEDHVAFPGDVVDGLDTGAR